jgi:general stress protein 26
MPETSNAEGEREKVWSLIQDIKVALMVTRNTDGALHARPMVAAQKGFDGVLWYLSREGAPKLGEILDDPHVLLAYSDPHKQNYVSVSGRASLVRDPTVIKAHWSEGARVWFPKGPDEGDICLIKVEAESAEYWDAPSASWVYAYGYVKARLTGEPPHHVGTNKVVGF